MFSKILSILILLLVPVISCGFAKVQGVFTGIKGKVGNTVFAGWKGEQVLKTRVIPFNPRTTAQTAQRGVLRTLVVAFKFLLDDIIKVFWNPFTSSKQTGWSNLISANLLAMAGTFDATKLILSKGSLESIYNLAATYKALDGAVVITWEKLTFLNGQTTDDLSFALFDDVSNEFIGYVIKGSSRNDTTVTFNVNSGYVAANVHLIAWASVDDAEGDVSICSNSQQVITTIPA